MRVLAKLGKKKKKTIIVASIIIINEPDLNYLFNSFSDYESRLQETEIPVNYLQGNCSEVYCDLTEGAEPEQGWALQKEVPGKIKPIPPPLQLPAKNKGGVGQKRM